ncbi:MAG: ATP-binding cassette domain-containing protein [Candidatus Lokiarchaeota archaeon]|nr:ATP-binding cassette domain-containing protein [Candidatus Lokiarchaeota archaeon]
MIRIENLSFTYNKTPSPALEGISLQVSKGDFILITGESGCGKTTLMRAVNGLIPHFYGGLLTGNIQVLGENPFELSPRKLSQHVGTVFQNPENQLFMSSVDSEIAFGMENLGFPKDKMDSRIQEVAEDLGFTNLLSRKITTLSGGEKQKVALASILVMGPEILLMDEPTSELDPYAAKELMELLVSLNQKHQKTIIITEHRLERVIDYIDRIVLMKKGKIIADSSPTEVIYKFPEARSFSPPIVHFFQNFPSQIRQTFTPLTLHDAISAMTEILKIHTPRKDFKFNPYTPPNPDSNPLLELSDIWFKYSTSSDWILREVSLNIYPGEFIAIMGRNGSGKTTLLKHMNGLLRPVKGKILLNGENANSKSVAEMARKVGYIFQNPSIQFYQDNLHDEFDFVLRNYGYKDERTRESAIRNCLKTFDLTRYSSRYGRFLSIGEQQRAALATVLLLKPTLLVLDEPTHGLDIGQKTDFMRFLNNYCSNGNSVILVTHDIETVAKYAHRVIILSEGGIVDDGLPHKILPNYEPFIPQINRLVKNFKEIPDFVLTAENLLEVFRNETQ